MRGISWRAMRRGYIVNVSRHDRDFKMVTTTSVA